MGFLDSLIGSIPVVGGLYNSLTGSGATNQLANAYSQGGYNIANAIGQSANLVAPSYLSYGGQLSNAYTNAIAAMMGTTGDTANLQMGMLGNASNLMTGMFGQAANGMSPYMTAGNNTLSQLMSMLGANGSFGGGFTANQYANNADGSYNWLQGEIANATGSQAAANGIYGSGTMGTALQNRSANVANSYYDAAYNRWLQTQQTGMGALANITNQGEAAAGTVGNWGMGTAQTVGNWGIGTGQNIAAQALASQALENQYGVDAANANGYGELMANQTYGNALVSEANAINQGNLGSNQTNLYGQNSLSNQITQLIGMGLNYSQAQQIIKLLGGSNSGSALSIMDSGISSLDSGGGSYLSDAFGSEGDFGWESLAALFA